MKLFLVTLETANGAQKDFYQYGGSLAQVAILAENARYRVKTVAECEFDDDEILVESEILPLPSAGASFKI